MDPIQALLCSISIYFSIVFAVVLAVLFFCFVLDMIAKKRVVGYVLGFAIAAYVGLAIFGATDFGGNKLDDWAWRWKSSRSIARAEKFFDPALIKVVEARFNNVPERFDSAFGRWSDESRVIKKGRIAYLPKSSLSSFVPSFRYQEERASNGNGSISLSVLSDPAHESGCTEKSVEFVFRAGKLVEVVAYLSGEYDDGTTVYFSAKGRPEVVYNYRGTPLPARSEPENAYKMAAGKLQKMNVNEFRRQRKDAGLVPPR